MGLEITIVTAQTNPSKSIDRSPRYEPMDGIQVYRPYKNTFEMTFFPERHISEVLRIANKFNPDVIFCSQQQNMRIAVKLRKHLGVPIVLLVEVASAIALGKSRSKLFSLAMQIQGIPYGRAYWQWLCKWSDAIITCYPKDKYVLNELSTMDTPVFYVPWPNQLPQEYTPANSRFKGRAMYAGAFSRLKNTDEFLETIPLLMERTPTEEFIFVGSGDLRVIAELKKKYGSKIRHIIKLSRNETLELLSSCYYAYTPAKIGGWGFIGECWATKTPLVMTHNDYCARKGVDTLVIGAADIDIAVNKIYDDQLLYESLRENGYKHYLEEHSAASIGEKLVDILTTVHEFGRSGSIGRTR
jgi:glycosyltransferase involved in cell wall biosynthesis